MLRLSTSKLKVNCRLTQTRITMTGYFLEDEIMERGFMYKSLMWLQYVDTMKLNIRATEPIGHVEMSLDDLSFEI